jgi:malonyl-CoA/methylmalonyl-CoA synthetase
MRKGLYQFLTKKGSKTPDAPFLDSAGGRRYSYRDLDLESARTANALRDLGVAPGDRVAAQTPKSPAALMLYLGAVRAGAVYVPLNTAYTPAELGYFLADAEPALMVCGPDQRDAIEPVAAEAGVPRVETLGANRDGSFAARTAAADTAFDDKDIEADDIASIIYTSGTTGRSKGAMLTQGNLISNAKVLAKAWRFTDSDRLLHVLPLYHVHGLFIAINTVLAAGASLHLLCRFDVDQVLAHLPDSTVMMGVPTFYIRLLQSPKLEQELIGDMRLFISGSAPLSSDIFAQFKARTGQAILERYGMSETGMNTSNPYDGERRAGTVGFALPGVDLRISDQQTGQPVAPGEVGVIEVRGPNVFKGYWRKPDLTANEFRSDGYFITGDLGRIDEDGYIWIVGRDKDLIISGGLNVYPAEIEAAIDAITGVSESAVIGVPHPDFGEGVTAVVAKESGAELDEQSIAKALEAEIAAFKRPKRIYFVEALPRNAMGKIQKNVLRENCRDAYQEV